MADNQGENADPGTLQRLPFCSSDGTPSPPSTAMPRSDRILLVPQDPRVSALHGQANPRASPDGLTGQGVRDSPRLFATGLAGPRGQGHRDRSVLRGMKDEEGIPGVDIAVGFREEVNSGLAGRGAE